jgi:hypothetical protein
LILGIFIGSIAHPNTDKLGFLSRQFSDALTEHISVGEQKRKMLFEDIFGKFEGFGVISIGGEHPDLQRPVPRLHPDNEKLSREILNFIERREVEIKDTIFDLDPNSVELKYNILSIGSAKSTLTTRMLEGYTGDDAKYLTRNPSLYLRWELLVDERKLFRKSKRYLQNKKWVRPNHIFLDNEKRSGQNMIAPLLHSDSWLKEDFLLISKLPNHITSHALQRGSYGIIVEGSHGTGTRALGLLVNNIELLSDLKNRIRDNTNWQAFYRIVVKHDHYRMISYPCKIKPACSDYVTNI